MKTTIAYLPAQQSLSVACSVLLHYAEREAAIAIDLALFPGSECDGIVWECEGREVDHALIGLGWTASALEAAIEAATSYRWLYFSPLSSVLFPAVEREREALDRAAEEERRRAYRSLAHTRAGLVPGAPLEGR